MKSSNTNGFGEYEMYKEIEKRFIEAIKVSKEDPVILLEKIIEETRKKYNL